jgi:glycine cleavage system H protein
MSSKHYTEDHEWIAVDGDTGTVGVSNFAQEQLGDVVFVEVPEIGRRVDKGEETAVVESVKAASEIYAPAGGEVIEANGALEEAPETVNADAEGAGWFFKLKISDPLELEGLMDEAAYKAMVAEHE